jgi:Mce-associated membrane protein
MVTKATVLDAAVTELDLSKGTASVIASVNVTRTSAAGAVSTVRNRFRASMTRTGGEWKLSNLGVVPVSLS